MGQTDWRTYNPNEAERKRYGQLPATPPPTPAGAPRDRATGGFSLPSMSDLPSWVNTDNALAAASLGSSVASFFPLTAPYAAGARVVSGVAGGALGAKEIYEGVRERDPLKAGLGVLDLAGATAAFKSIKGAVAAAKARLAAKTAAASPEAMMKAALDAEAAKKGTAAATAAPATVTPKGGPIPKAPGSKATTSPIPKAPKPGTRVAPAETAEQNMQRRMREEALKSGQPALQLPKATPPKAAPPKATAPKPKPKAAPKPVAVSNPEQVIGVVNGKPVTKGEAVAAALAQPVKPGVLPKVTAPRPGKVPGVKAVRALTPEEQAAETIRARLAQPVQPRKGPVPPPAAPGLTANPMIDELAEAQRVADAMRAARTPATVAKPARDFAAQTAKAREARAVNRAARAKAAAEAPPVTGATATGVVPATAPAAARAAGATEGLVNVRGHLVRAAFDDPIERRLYQHAADRSPAVNQYLQQELKVDAATIEKLATDMENRVHGMAQGLPRGSTLAVAKAAPAAPPMPAPVVPRGSNAKRAIPPAGTVRPGLLPPAVPPTPSVSTATAPRLVKNPAAAQLAKAERLAAEKAAADAASAGPGVGDSLRASLAAGPVAPSVASAPVGDLADLPTVLANYNSAVKAAAKLTKAGQELPDTLRQQLVESTQLLSELAPQAVKHQKEINAALKKGVTAIVGARATVPGEVAGLGNAINRTAGKLDKAARARIANPEARAAADSTRALGKKIGASDETLDKMEEAIAKAAKRAKTPKEKKAIKSLADSTSKIIKQLGKLPGDETGSASAQLMARLGATAGGGYGGWVGGDKLQPEGDERSPLAWKVAGAAAGALSANALSGLAMSGSHLKAAEKIVDWSRFGMLSSPKTMAQANIGALNAVFVKALERLVTGHPIQAAKGMAELAKESGKGVWFKAAFGDPQKYIKDPALRAAFGKTGGRAQLGKGKTGFMSWPARTIAAGDVVSSNAIMAMGYPREAAMAANLSAEPATALGRGITRGLNEPFREKIVGKVSGKVREVVHKPYINPKEHPYINAGYRAVAPFVKSMVNALEQGVSYTPGLALTTRKSMGFSKGESAARQLIGAGAMGLGAASTRVASPDADSFINSMAGPMTLPMYIGQRGMRAIDRDAPLQGIAQTAFEEIPMVAEQFGIQDLLLGRPLVPGAIRDVARAIDPAWERGKGPSEIIEEMRKGEGPVSAITETLKTMSGGALSRFPVLREALPEQFAKHDVYGKSTYPARNAFLPGFIEDVTLRGASGKTEIVQVIRPTLPRMLTSKPLVNPPDLPTDDPYTAEIRAVERAVPNRGKILSPPTVPQFRELENFLREGGRQPLKRVDRDLRAALLRAKGVTTELQAKRMMNEPMYNSALDPRRHFLLEQARDMASEFASGITTPAMQGVTMDPNQRNLVLRQLQDYIQMVEPMVPR